MVIHNFKTYESSNSWSDDYIVCLPSGEVIYCSDEDIKTLTKLNYVFFDQSRGILNLNRNVCTDFFAPKVKEYLRSKPDSFLNNKTLIKEFLILDCGLLKDQFKIFDDLSVDAMGPVNITYKHLTKIPVKFNRCTSDFNCSYNNLRTLENTPRSVHGAFNCSYNELEDLSGGPRLVARMYNCSHNKLRSLEGAPLRLKYFNCSHNFLRNLDKAPVVTDNFVKNDNLFR